MENTLFCAAVRDLAALYTDGQTSPETTDAIRAHLDGCAACRRYYKDYRRSGAAQQHTAPATPAAPAPADGYASLASRMRRRNTLAGVLYALSVLVAAMAGFLYATRPRDDRR